MKFTELWRPIEIGDPDEMGFCRGGGTRLIFAALILFFLSSLQMTSLLLHSRKIWRSLLLTLRFKHYGMAASLYALAGAEVLLFALAIFVGVWFIFGRTVVVLERTKNSLTINYTLSSFRLFSRHFAVDKSSAFVFDRKIRSFVPFHFLMVKDAAGKRRGVLVINRSFAEEGWAMAGQMAGFFGVSLFEA